ncbi:MAG: porin family protein [Bacteroidota bacterium]
MRKILLLLLIFFSIQAKSQVLIALLFGDKLNQPGIEFGLEGGFNWSTMSGLETDSYLRSWNLGFYFDFKMKNQWHLYTGVLVKAKKGIGNLSKGDLSVLNASLHTSINGSPIEGDYNQTLNYFLVPALARYYFKHNIYAELGPQFGLLHRGWIEFNSDIKGMDATVKEYNGELINKFDMGLMGGIGYKTLGGTGWSYGVKYYYGFIDVYKDIPKTKNSSIFIKVNIPIGIGDKEKAEEDLSTF